MDSVQSNAHAVRIPVGAVEVAGDLVLPPSAAGIILFAHGSGSSRLSPRNQFVAQRLRNSGLATLLLDLLTEEEELIDQRTRALRFDIHLLAGRLREATQWLAQDKRTADLAVGYFGASTGAAAALIAAAELTGRVHVVVSRGGRPDLAEKALARVQAGTLLIVGGNDDVVMELNKQALARLHTPNKKLTVVPGATHLFEEPGTLEQVAQLAAEWFRRYLPATQHLPVE